MINVKKIKEEMKMNRNMLIDIFYKETGELVDFYIDEENHEISIKVWINCFVIIKNEHSNYLEFKLDIFDSDVEYLRSLNDFKETLEIMKTVEEVLKKHEILLNNRK